MKHTFIVFAALIQFFIAMGQSASKPIAMGARSHTIDSAVKNKIAQWMEGNAGLTFLENKGQMTDMQGNPVSALLFKASGNAVDMYITTGGLSYVFTRKEILKSKKLNKSGGEQDSITGQYCRADMELVGADIRKENIIKEEESKDYNNYYLGKICPDGILNVHSYKRVTIKNIYPGIDWVLYTNGRRESANGMPSPVGEGKEGVEYDFIVHPGADPSVIKLRYKYSGQEDPGIQNDGSLKINTPLGNILEGTPVTYQYSLNIPVRYTQSSAPSEWLSRAGISYYQSTNIPTAYTLNKGEVGFALAGYDKSKTLVIDPALRWTLNWSTYYGGTGADVGNSIYNDGTDIWITGSTSSTNFPTLNSYQGTLTSGVTNVFISCFSAATGAPVWETYYGGSSSGENDAGEGISGDANNIWVFAQVNNTGSNKPASTTFPTANPNNYNWYETYNTLSNNTTLNGTSPSGGIGSSAPAILEFQKSSGSRLYATYITGSSADYAGSVSDDGAHVWFAGTANSNNFPVLYSTGYYNSSGSGNGAFIIEYTTGGSLLWSTYFQVCTNGEYSEASSICSDGTNVWLTGNAYTGTIPTNDPGGSAFYQSASPTANACAFIAKFNIANIANGSQPVWSTFYGGNAGSSGLSVQSFNGGWDRTGYGQAIYSNGTNVWVTGATGSSDFATQTPALLLNPGGGAYFQSTNSVSGTVNGFHAFIAEFNASTCALEWGTYYGGSGTNPPGYTAGLPSDMGTSIQSDVNGNVWITGETSSKNFPTLSFPCAYNQDVLQGTQNAFLLEFNSSGARQWATYFGGGTDEASSVWSNGSNVWITGSTTSSSFPLQNLSGAYNQAANGGGAEDAFISEFVAKPSLTVTMGTPTNICNGSTTGSATVDVSGGTPPYTYSWTPVSGSTATLAQLSAGNYKVYVNDAYGCFDSAAVTIYQSPPMAVTVGTPTEPSCNEINGGSVQVTVRSGTTPYTYSWSPAGGTNATGTGLSTGVYRVYITDAAGCGDSSTFITLTQPALMVLAVSQSGNISCNGVSDGSAIVSITNGATPYTYSWSPAGGAAAVATALSAGTYTITAQDKNQCSQTTSINITQPAPIAGTVSNTNEFCFGYSTASATVTPSGGTAPYNYLWNPGGQNGPTANQLSVGAYTVTVTDATGCSESFTVSISQPAQTAVTFSSNVTQGCLPFCIQFQNTTPVSAGTTPSYLWTFGNGDTSHAQSPAYCYSSAGIYSVALTVSTYSGCDVTLTKANMITAFSSPNASFTYSPQTATILSPTVQFTDHSSDAFGIIQWWWNFGDQTDSESAQQNSEHTYKDTGTYCATLVATDVNGCTDTATNCLVIEPFYTLYIPDAFTPNGDGINDIFMVKGQYIKSFEMYIFDKWGEQIFYSNNINDGWNGTAKGTSNICREDTYVYKILATDYSDKQYSYTGSITLLK